MSIKNLNEQKKQPDIILTRRIRILSQLKATKARFFSDLQVGDVVSVVTRLRRTTNSRGNSPAIIEVWNKRKDSLDRFTQTIFMNGISKFEYEVVE